LLKLKSLYIKTGHKSLLVFVLLVFLFGSCNTTKYVPENEYLLNKVRIRTENSKIDKDELHNYIQQKPNRRTLFIFKFHLSIYNIANGGKERKWKNWIKDVIGEEPVIYDEYLEKKNKKATPAVFKKQRILQRYCNRYVESTQEKSQY